MIRWEYGKWTVGPSRIEGFILQCKREMTEILKEIQLLLMTGLGNNHGCKQVVGKVV